MIKKVEDKMRELSSIMENVGECTSCL